MYSDPYQNTFQNMQQQIQQQYQQRMAQIQQQYPQLQQSAYAQPIQQPQQQNVAQNTMRCIAVTSVEEAKAYIADPMGGVAMFYNAGGGCFYTKQIGLDGLPIFNTYTLQAQPEQQRLTPEMQVMQQIWNEITEMKGMLYANSTTSDAAANWERPNNAEPDATHPGKPKSNTSNKPSSNDKSAI